MNGTGQGFDPDGTVTRGTLMTILARMDGVDTAGGRTWYEKGMAWAVSAGVSDGANPEGVITREQAAVMLYRYAGSPAVSGDGLSQFPGRRSSGPLGQPRYALGGGRRSVPGRGPGIGPAGQNHPGGVGGHSEPFYNLELTIGTSSGSPAGLSGGAIFYVQTRVEIKTFTWAAKNLPLSLPEISRAVADSENKMEE